MHDESSATDEQQATLLLWQRVNASLSAFYKLNKAFGSSRLALQHSSADWANLGIHASHNMRHNEATAAQDATFIAAIEQSIQQGQYKLVFKDDATYPPQLAQLFDPPPLLFYRGELTRLQQAQIAIVGSRSPTQKAQKFTFDMAQYLAAAGYIITSGLAQGVDAQAHLGALAQPPEQSGHTVGVMGTGIDVCYPAQHQPLFTKIVAEGGCIISELLPGTTPHKHTFPRRNRLVAGLSLGTIVTEAAIKSGSLITARLAAEQGKQVFALPSSIDNPNAEGCHHLIREGATLIYHPDQVIQELASQLVSPAIHQAATKPSFEAKTSSQTQLATFDSTLKTNSIGAVKPSIAIPKHLQPLWVHLSFEAQDLDALVTKTALATSTLLAQLMELELLGAISQVAGRYMRL